MMKYQLDMLTREELEELGLVLQTFMYHLRPIPSNTSWILDFFTTYDSVALFRWVDYIDELIDKPFPTVSYRDKAHSLGDLIQKKFNQENIKVTLQHPLFFYIATFYQIFDLYGMIAVYFDNDPNKLQALMRFDQHLDNHIMIDYSRKVLAIIPGMTSSFKILQYIVNSGIILINKVVIYQAQLENLPEFFSEIPSTEVHLYRIQNSDIISSTSTLKIYYH